MCLVLASPSLAGAQVTGVVRDSVAGRRVPGAVITVLDSSRKVIARSLADDSGRFRIETTGPWRLRVVKIGYRPKELRVSSPASVSIALDRLPSILEPMRTSDQPRCPRNPTRPTAFGLWEQAQAALLGTVLAREANTAHVTRINYRRYMTPGGDRIARQSVHLDFGAALRSFDANYPASEFGKRGFVTPVSEQQLEFFGPDAEVLLDDALIDYYCLEMAAPQPARPNQAGLRFRPLGRADGRVDIDGTLWIDTIARSLVDVEFVYLGLDRWATPLRPGGRIGFQEISPAVVWIDGWSIRMTGAGIDSGQRVAEPESNRRRVVEGGAELASADWRDGRRWAARLGAAELTVVSPRGAALPGARVQLDSTDYGGETDSLGRLRIDRLLPGPYTVSVYDSTLAVVDTTLPGNVGFTAARDSTARVTVAVPALEEFTRRGCMEENLFDPRSMMFVMRIVDDAGRPVNKSKWRLLPPENEKDPNAPQGYYAFGETGANGMVFVCVRLIGIRRVVLQAWKPRTRGDAPAVAEPVALNGRITSYRLVLPP
jgi:hypothetical protein